VNDSIGFVWVDAVYEDRDVRCLVNMDRVDVIMPSPTGGARLIWHGCEPRHEMRVRQSIHDLRP
jgi:hypothetical protein